MDTPEQAQLREHVRELRQAARGIGRDLKLEFSDLDEKIDRLGRLTAKEAKYAVLDLQEDLATMNRRIDAELRKIPGAVHDGVVNAGAAIRDGTVAAAVATRDAFVDAGHATKEASKNGFARLAGVNRKPMKEWKNPP
jgi:hypothetical protein